MRTSRRGFTLIELLVVIAIIAILAAILLPVFARARENARKAACGSNLKQLGSAMMQYTQDFDERVPMAWYAGGAWNGGTAAQPLLVWADLLMPYLKSSDIFVCPSRPTKGTWGSNEGIKAKVCYGVHCSALGWERGRSLAEFTAPARIIFSGDQFSNTDDGRICPLQPGNGAWCPPGGGGKVHVGGCNYAYFDGHTKWLLPEQAYGTNNATALPMWDWTQP